MDKEQGKLIILEAIEQLQKLGVPRESVPFSRLSDQELEEFVEAKLEQLERRKKFLEVD